jgi:hypothetical protein
MAMATRVAGDEEGDGSKRDDDDTTISLALATATRVEGDEEGDRGKSNGDKKKGGSRATAAAMKRVMAKAAGG